MNFWLDQVIFVGHVIFKRGIEVDLKKVEAVFKWEIPTNVPEVCSYPDMVGYYRRYVKRFRGGKYRKSDALLKD